MAKHISIAIGIINSWEQAKYGSQMSSSFDVSEDEVRGRLQKEIQEQYPDFVLEQVQTLKIDIPQDEEVIWKSDVDISLERLVDAIENISVDPSECEIQIVRKKSKNERSSPNN